MVEIRRTDVPGSGSNGTKHTADDDDKYRLVYSKSKVYVNPTAYARDNIPGFVAFVKREAINPIYLLAWIPETLLNERGTSEWDKFVKVEEQPRSAEEDDDIVLIELPGQRPESYAFSVPITSIYSLIVNPPSLSSWYGSIGINLINGDTLPTLHFHDDESHSFTFQSPRSAQSNGANVTPYPPPPTQGSSHVQKSVNSWGGEDLLSRLRNYAHLLRSTLQPSLFLVDPSRADIEAHTTQIFSDEAVDDILAQSSFANSHSPVPAHRRPRPISEASSSANPYSHRTSVLHRSLGSPSLSPTNPSSQARMALLQSFSNITRATRHAAQNILSHPLAKPIVPHLPDPVRSLVNANGEWEWGSWVEKGGVGEFESARVYLARWARIVAEEGERARRKEAQALPPSAAGVVEEDSSLGIFELLHSTANLPTPKSSRNPAHPVDERLWASWFGRDGRPNIVNEEMRREVFRRGINPKGTLRQRIWPFVLGVYEWDVTSEERKKLWREKRNKYQSVKDEWCGVPDVFDSTKILEERHRIDVDCRRTDRNQPMFSAPAEIPTTDLDESDEKAHQRHYSIISPNMNDIGAQSPSNEHVDRMAGILLTYNFYEKDLGYVQGMSDLCAPLYIVMGGNEELTFWCFVEVMNRMKQNFLRDQSGMKKQLSTLQQLIEVMDPELFRHLEKTDALNLFFCFRWVLISFKREFAFEDVLRLWEVLWTDYYTSGFVLFVALAVLESHRDMILRYLVEFDEILKYCNELSMTIELDTTLSQAEVLFLSFSQIVADIDRRKAEQSKENSGVLRNRASGTAAAKLAATNLAALQLSDELRDLLKTNRVDCSRDLPSTMAAHLTILRTYAQAAPETLPASILFKHSPKNITIFDAYPKSIFHFLILPRVQEPLKLTASTLDSLRTLLNAGNRELAKQVVTALAEEARVIKREIQEEMVQRYGFKWDVWTGFHAAPSMHHIHLHVLSADLCSEKMKHKKHYNTFHPKLGFFLHIDDVLSWFDSEPTYYSKLIKDFKPSKYEPILKEKLLCFHCNAEMKNIPTLKAHLQEEWNKLERRGQEIARRKRKFEDRESAANKGEKDGSESSTSKKVKSSTSESTDDAPSPDKL
ncbi:hypothetical protein CVT25_015627 [Psilocybe cyanescens]|uniref:Rab-GAP TBC domain-containing protein n=1 Tax=Psilocybe cyanescens TaxID=93625 RepID=A0A409WHV8_PSICY|nr:hypothetical protein CVT25_015627 [Psilocybe cyanescens]